MNKLFFIITIIVIIAFSGCKKQDTITGPAPAPQGKFVVDSIGTTVAIKEDTVLNKLEAYLTFSVVYHYENYPGILSQINLLVKNSSGSFLTLDYLGPESVNALHRFTNFSARLPDSLQGQDSVLINRTLNGSFWTKNADSGYYSVGTFSWKDSLYVNVER
ncbi:MAG: hypothetical protein WCA84_04215 [Ignavibacteriaceae bacterium]